MFPLLAVALKVVAYPGWILAIMLFTGFPLLLGYAAQIVIASVSMFRARGAFNTMPGAWRGLTAAWCTSLGVLISAFFLIDGGDDGVYGSAFTALLGVSSTPEGERLSMTLFTVFAVVWVAGWCWLVTEWTVLGVRARRRARAAHSGGAPGTQFPGSSRTPRAGA